MMSMLGTTKVVATKCCLPDPFVTTPLRTRQLLSRLIACYTLRASRPVAVAPLVDHGHLISRTGRHRRAAQTKAGPAGPMFLDRSLLVDLFLHIGGKFSPTVFSDEAVVDLIAIVGFLGAERLAVRAAMRRHLPFHFLHEIRRA